MSTWVCSILSGLEQKHNRFSRQVPMCVSMSMPRSLAIVWHLMSIDLHSRMRCFCIRQSRIAQGGKRVHFFLLATAQRPLTMNFEENFNSLLYFENLTANRFEFLINYIKRLLLIFGGIFPEKCFSEIVMSFVFWFYIPWQDRISYLLLIKLILGVLKAP